MSVETGFEEFVDYFTTNYPGTVKFHNHRWHAEKIWRAVLRANESASPTPPEAQGESAWISVEDRLPPKNERLLLRTDYEDGDVGLTFGCYQKSIWTDNKWGFLDEQDEQPGQEYPSHWMLASALIPSIEQREG